MRLYSFFASQIDFLKNDCVKLLALNSARCLTYDDLFTFRNKLSDLLDLLSEKPEDSYFAKK